MGWLWNGRATLTISHLSAATSPPTRADGKQTSTGNVGAHCEIPLDRPLKLNLPGNELEISLDCRNSAFGADGSGECPLVAAEGGRRQVLASFTIYRPQPNLEFAAEANPRLLWAGDLDRDGRLDVLIDLSNHYSVSRPTLFLSAPATGDDKLRKVAEFVTTGC